MPAQALTRDDLDRIHRLLSEDITALETERFNALDAPETRREKETELEAARATRQRVEAALAAPQATAGNPAHPIKRELLTAMKNALPDYAGRIREAGANPEKCDRWLAMRDAIAAAEAETRS